MFPPNFQRLAFHRDWRSTWTHIVAGKFSNAPYDGLLFYEQSTGYAEFYETNGFGNISFLASHGDLFSHFDPAARRGVLSVSPRRA